MVVTPRGRGAPPKVRVRAGENASRSVNWTWSVCGDTERERPAPSVLLIGTEEVAR